MKAKDENNVLDHRFHPSSFDLADLARFERATSTFAESRSGSAELQVRNASGGARAALTATSAVARITAETWRRRQESNLHAQCAAI